MSLTDDENSIGVRVRLQRYQSTLPRPISRRDRSTHVQFQSIHYAILNAQNGNKVAQSSCNPLATENQDWADHFQIFHLKPALPSDFD